jgi:hypothetical protein
MINFWNIFTRVEEDAEEKNCAYSGKKGCYKKGPVLRLVLTGCCLVFFVLNLRSANQRNFFD